MENEYKFVSKFIEGKTYKELTTEEIEKLKSGIGVKKEDKEYIDSLEKVSNELEETIQNEEDEKIVNEVVEDKKEEHIETTNDKKEEKIKKSKNGVKVIQAMGRKLKLEDNRTIILKEEELKEKTFWRKGDIYYG